MPAKIARLATRPLFWIPEVSVAVRSSRPSCSKAEKREYSWQIGSHPGNPGLLLSLEPLLALFDLRPPQRRQAVVPLAERALRQRTPRAKLDGAASAA